MRLWLALSLTVVLAFAGFACAQESSCLTVKKVSASHHALQQGGDIELTVKLVTTNCSIPIDVKAPGKTDFFVLIQEGFEASHSAVEIDGIEGAPINGTWMAHAVTARFTLHAFRAASVGAHTIPATLIYTAQDANGDIASHTLALDVPVKVIEPPKPGFWVEHPEARQRLVTTGEVLLLIVVMPFWIIGSMLGFFRWDC